MERFRKMDERHCSGTRRGSVVLQREVSLKESVDAAWAQVENQLQRRNDLIPNLVEVTKGYATHEREIHANCRRAFTPDRRRRPQRQDRRC
jgi:hypothetical protein